MNHKKLNLLIAFSVFIVSLVTYVLTLPPTVVFWDVAEFCAAAFSLQVEHPPGAPFFLLLARVSAMIPLVQDIAVRMHLLSALSGAATCALLYLLIVKLMVQWRGIPVTTFDRSTVYGSAVIGALSLTFSQSFWFNAVEAEVFALSMLLVSLILWLGMKWYEREEKETGDVYIIMIAYILGISVGVRMLAVLALFPVIFFWYFRNSKTFEVKSFLKFGVAAFIIFLLVYPGIVNTLPSMLKGELGKIKSPVITYIPFALLLGALYGIYYSVRKKKRILNVAFLSFLFIVLGYSTYTMVYIRASIHPPMNMNDPSSPERFVSYLNREQYGAAPIINRRWDTDPDKQRYHKNYKSDLDYMWTYQIEHMYLRYLGWNYIGSEGDFKDAGVNWKQYYMIPFLLGLLGAFYQWRKQPQMAFIMFLTFTIMGIVLTLYQNQQEPQPRERDYFYLGSFFVFSLWIGFGVIALIDFIKEKIASKRAAQTTGYGILVFAFMFVPMKMLKSNYHQQNRSGNYVPWDYSYNMLQSCEKDAILITNGDNDTFPLWYLQDVEGVRRDIRVVNLSLVNTPWYIKQLKHQTPYGAKTVPISTPDVEIENIQPIQFEPRWMELPVDPNVVQQFRTEKQNKTLLLDTSIMNSGVIRFLMPNTLQFGKIKAIRAQDIMVYDIITSSNWQRPVYFAMTVSDDNKIGLHEYLQLTGLAFKLVPFKTQNYWANLNESVVRQNIFADIKQFSKEPQYGFRWRGFQDSSTYYDEDTRRLLTSNYRNLFVSYSLYCINVKNQPQQASEILERMEQVIPQRSVPMEYRVKFDIASIYNTAGNQSRYREYLHELVQEIKPLMNKPATEQLSQYNPHIILFRCYDELEMFQEAEDLLPLIKSAYPKQQGIDQIIAQLRNQIQARRAMAQMAQQPQTKKK